MEQPGGEYAEKDDKLYRVFNVGEGEIADVPQGKYLVDDDGRIRYLIDPAINGRVVGTTPDGKEARVRDEEARLRTALRRRRRV